MCSSRWNIHTPQGGGQQKFRGEGGGVQKDAISEWVGGGGGLLEVFFRGIQVRLVSYQKLTAALLNKLSVILQLTIFWFLLAKRFSDLDNPDCLDFRASRNKNLK